MSGLNPTSSDDVSYFTRFGNLSDFSENKGIPSCYPSMIAGLLNTANKSIHDNPAAGDIVFLFKKHSYFSVSKKNRNGYPLLLDENNNVLERGTSHTLKNVFLADYMPITQIVTDNQDAGLLIKKSIDYLLDTKKIVDFLAKNIFLLHFNTTNLMFRGEQYDQFVKEGLGGPETGNIHPLLAGSMLQSCVKEPVIKNIQKHIDRINLAKEIYTILQGNKKFEIIIEVLGENYLENAETSLKLFEKQAVIQDKQAELRKNSITNLETSLGVKAKEIDIKEELGKIGKAGENISQDELMEALEKIILATLAT